VVGAAAKGAMYANRTLEKCIKFCFRSLSAQFGLLSMAVAAMQPDSAYISMLLLKSCRRIFMNCLEEVLPELAQPHSIVIR